MNIPTLRPYQARAIDFYHSNPNKFTYLGLYPGAGKTLTSLLCVLQTPDIKSILIICPSSVVNVWRDEVEKFKMPFNVVVQTKRTTPKIGHMHVVSYHNAPFLKAKFDMVIIDEAHYLKTWTAKRTRRILVNKDSFCSNAKKVILLSGTPVLNRPIELYPILRVSDTLPKERYTYNEYAMYFCHGYINGYGKMIASGASHIDKLREYMPNFFIVGKEEVEKELPPLQQTIVRLDFSQRLSYNKLPYDIEAVVRRESAVGFDGLAELRHKMAMEKVERVTEYTSDLLATGDKVIIFGWHTDFINHIADKLQCSAITGATSSSKRRKLFEEFQEGKHSALVCQLAAVSEGVSFTQARHVVFGEISWTPSQNQQALKRVHRHGQTSPVEVHYLVQDRSIDDYILQRVFEKESLINHIFNPLKNVEKLVDKTVIKSYNTIVLTTKESKMLDAYKELKTTVEAAFKKFESLLAEDEPCEVPKATPAPAVVENHLPPVPPVVEAVPVAAVAPQPAYTVTVDSPYQPWQQKLRDHAMLLNKKHGVTFQQIKDVVTPFIDTVSFVAQNPDALKFVLKFIPQDKWELAKAAIDALVPAEQDLEL